MKRLATVILAMTLLLLFAFSCLSDAQSSRRRPGGQRPAARASNCSEKLNDIADSLVKDAAGNFDANLNLRKTSKLMTEGQ